MTDKHPSPAPVGEFTLFKNDDDRARIECRFQLDTLLLTQASIAGLYDKDVRTINEHLINIFSFLKIQLSGNSG
ncbi:hypothetical protein [Serratia nevei]|uniref:hypothetical protein n=1 Tax=Serratia nevei TaxID=2703794 RepID=UPI003FA736C1